ncbi:MAG: hypothetical protein RIA10_07510 [Amphiplicatus sp.]
MTKEILDLLTKWAGSLTSSNGAGGVYVFGSLIYRNGAQFGPASDIDLVLLFPTKLKTSEERLQWLQSLHAEKRTLENELAKALGRPADKPICSFVVPTAIEVEGNLHKDGSPAFFNSNRFLNLLTNKPTEGLPGSGTQPVADPLAQMCFRFAQKKRNQYLDVSGDGATAFADFDESDPLPKDIMRHAAMASALATPGYEKGAEYDIQAGLDFLTNKLYEARQTSPFMDELHNRISIRRNARGKREAVSARDQAFLAEWIFDQAENALVAKARAKAAARPRLQEHSTVFFAKRFGDAFPGVRGIASFEDAAEIKERLDILFKPPIKFENGSPIWMWRDGNIPIEGYQAGEPGFYLMGPWEFNITKLVAVGLPNYYQNFVYIETAAMPSVGVDGLTENMIAESVKHSGYCWEEYGLVDGEHAVRRAEYDDGSARINGKLQQISGRVELRIRQLAPYNFVLAASLSPINNSNFDRDFGVIMNGLLRGDNSVEELAKAIRQLPKNAF